MAFFQLPGDTMVNTVSFPGLGLEFDLNRVAVVLFGRNVYWYGVIIGLGFLLAVLWLRVLYPPMERTIERLPPLAGKILTWLLIALMLCNAALTSAAMLRYTDRRSESPRSGIVPQFLDERYPDSYMERRWPNMIVTE